MSTRSRIIDRDILTESFLHKEFVEELVHVGLGAPHEQSDSRTRSDQHTSAVQLCASSRSQPSPATSEHKFPGFLWGRGPTESLGGIRFRDPRCKGPHPAKLHTTARNHASRPRGLRSNLSRARAGARARSRATSRGREGGVHYSAPNSPPPSQFQHKIHHKPARRVEHHQMSLDTSTLQK